MNKTLDISLDGIPQGVLTVLPDKTWQLVLHANAQRLSLSFPRQQTISGAVVQRWFENLLPESGERLVAERRLQVRRGDSLMSFRRNSKRCVTEPLRCFSVCLLHAAPKVFRLDCQTDWVFHSQWQSS